MSALGKTKAKKTTKEYSSQKKSQFLVIESSYLWKEKKIQIKKFAVKQFHFSSLWNKGNYKKSVLIFLDILPKRKKQIAKKK